jgi:hypothetical protein
MEAQLRELLSMVTKPFENALVRNFTRLFLVMYAGLVAPRLPRGILRMFDNMIVRIFILFLVSFFAGVDPVSALLLAIGFIVSMQMLHNQDLFGFLYGEGFDDPVNAPPPANSVPPAFVASNGVINTGVPQSQTDVNNTVEVLNAMANGQVSVSNSGQVVQGPPQDQESAMATSAIMTAMANGVNATTSPMNGMPPAMNGMPPAMNDVNVPSGVPSSNGNASFTSNVVSNAASIVAPNGLTDTDVRTLNGVNSRPMNGSNTASANANVVMNASRNSNVQNVVNATALGNGNVELVTSNGNRVEVTEEEAEMVANGQANVISNKAGETFLAYNTCPLASNY